jgi:hypothetical protein
MEIEFKPQKLFQRSAERIATNVSATGGQP